MGGSESGFSSGYSGGGSGGPACESIDFEAAIASPDPRVIAILKIGDSLSVSKEDNPERIALRTATNDIAGSVVEGWQDLIRCIPAHKYIAVVVELEPVARVNIRWHQ